LKDRWIPFLFLMIISRGWGSHTIGKSIVVWNAWLACTILHPRETRLILHNCCIHFLSRDMIVPRDLTQTNCVERERERERESELAQDLCQNRGQHSSRLQRHTSQGLLFIITDLKVCFFCSNRNACQFCFLSRKNDCMHARMHDRISEVFHWKILSIFFCCTVVT
jgi:hypothetical protein